MAKGYTKVKEVHEKATPRLRELRWKSSRGVEVILKGMPPLMMTNIESAVTMPEKPTYTITTAAGDIETYDHDETTVQTDEEKIAWRKYIVEKAIAEDRLTELTLKAILYDGVELANADDLARWRKKCRIIGLPVPEDLDEATLMFKETEVIGGNEDMEYILTNVMRLSGVSESIIESASQSFQDNVESGSQNGQGEPTEQPQSKEG